MRLFLLVLACLSLSRPLLAQPAPRAGVPTLSADAEARWVPFELTPGNQIRFAMTLNGHAATAILDTGVNISVASRDFAEAAGLKRAATGRVEAIGGAVDVGWAAIESLAIAGATRMGGRIAILDLKPIQSGDGRTVDVLIGSDILSYFALDVDPDARRFRLIPSGRLPFRGSRVPLRLARDSNGYLVDLTVGGRRLRPMLVDLGDGASVTLTRTMWNASAPPGVVMTSAITYGLGGPVETGLAILPQVRIGAVLAQNVEVRIERDDGFSGRMGSAGRIGNALLQRYRMLLDPRAGVMLLAPAASPPATPRSTSGLLVGYDNGRFDILHVMQGSPAAAERLTTADTICAVDGQPVRSTEGMIDTGWAAGTPGRTVELTLCDGREVGLTLAYFY